MLARRIIIYIILTACFATLTSTAYASFTLLSTTITGTSAGCLAWGEQRTPVTPAALHLACMTSLTL